MVCSCVVKKNAYWFSPPPLHTHTHVRVWSCHRWSSKVVSSVRWGYEQSSGFYKPSGKAVLPDYQLLPSKQYNPRIAVHTVLIYLTLTTSPFLPNQMVKQNGNWGSNLDRSPSVHIRLFKDGFWNREMLWDKGNSRYSCMRLTSSQSSTGTQAILKALFCTQNLASIMTDSLGWKPKWGPSTQPACQIK